MATEEQTAPVVLVVGGGWDGAEDGPLSVGCAICLRLARDGYRVVVFDLEDENAEQTIVRMRAEGLEGYKIVGDTAMQEDCKGAVDEVVERFGRLDHVINNVGIGVLRQHEPGTQAYIDRIVAVNFTGPMLMVAAAAPRAKTVKSEWDQVVGLGGFPSANSWTWPSGTERKQTRGATEPKGQASVPPGVVGETALEAVRSMSRCERPM